MHFYEDFTLAINQKNKKKKRFIEQYIEECEKACILEKGSDWESAKDKIIEAEDYGFFNGTIRFLYRNGSGEPEFDDPEYFMAKYEKARELFPDENDRANKVPMETIQKFYKCFTKIEDLKRQLVFTHDGYDNRNPCWKTGILCNPDYTQQVDMLLSGKTAENIEDDYESFLKEVYNKRGKIFGKSAEGKYWITEIMPGKTKMERKGARGDTEIYLPE